jgi:AcrR family transcriptional regulator
MWSFIAPPEKFQPDRISSPLKRAGKGSRDFGAGSFSAFQKGTCHPHFSQKYLQIPLHREELCYNLIRNDQNVHLVIKRMSSMTVDRRQQIIDAAARSFSLFGYKATTMDQIARLANVGKGTIYLFFKNKEDLLDAIISSLIGEIKEAAERVMDPGLPFATNVHRALYQILEFRQRHQLTAKLLQEVRNIGTLEVQQVLKKLDWAMIGFIREKIEAAVKKQEIRECDAEITAFLMLKVYIALIVDWEQDHPPLSKEKIAELFKLYFLKGLSK